MRQALWSLREVTLPGRVRPRLDRVCLEIPAGICAVAGESGAGKTSLLNLLVGYERPESGRLERLFDPGAASIDRRTAEGRLPLYWCPPDDGLWPNLSVREHLAAVSPGGSASARRIEQILAAFGLAELAGAHPALLSEGERARVSAARALTSGARVLVMDEPFAHVNRSLARGCWDALRDACAVSDTSLVFSSHDPEAILREASHIVCLQQGRVAWTGPVDELYQRPPSRELAEFLGPVNWFEVDDAAHWLHVELDGPRGVRPERIDLTPAHDGVLVVERAAAAGTVGETRVRDERSGHSRWIVHRAAAAPLRRGTRVALSVILLLLLALGLSGCEGSAAGQTLPVSQIRTWSLPVENGLLPAPRAMTFAPQGELFVLDDVGRVVVYAADGTFSRSWWMPEYSAGRPEGIAVLRDGRLAIADTHYHRVVFFSQSGTLLGMFGEEGEEPGQFIFPCDVAEDAQGNLYVSEYGGNDRVQKFTADAQFLLEFGEAGTGPGQFQRTAGLAWHDGLVYVADSINNRVQVFSDSGQLVSLAAGAPSVPVDYPYDLTILPDGRIHIVEYKSGRVTQLSPRGELLGRYGSTGRGAGEFWTPWGLAVAPDGRIVVADTGNRRIVELTP